MKKIANGFLTALTLIALLTGAAMGALTSPGDIAIIAFNADGGDDFAFVTLVDIPASAVIYFTDNEWTGTAFNDLGEGEITWTNGESVLSAGSVVVFTDPINGGGTVNIGSHTGNGWNLGASNETFFALLEEPATSYASPPTFLAGASNDLSGSGATLTGTGLTLGTNFIDFANDHDGFKYTGSRSSAGSFAGYLALVNNSANWQDEADDGELILPISTTAFTTSAGAGPDDPTSFASAVVSANQINLTWTNNAAGNNVIIAFNSDGNFTDPVNGTSYSVDQEALGGEILYKNTTESFNHVGLSANTAYYYKAWSVDGSNNYSSGVTIDATTLKAEPTAHVTDEVADSKTHNSVTLSWTASAGGADGYFVTANGAPSDGTQSGDADGQQDVSGTTATVTGLNSETEYTFYIYPYNNSGSGIDYKTDGVVPSVTETTTATPATVNIFFSEYIEGSGYNKAIEIYNASASSIDLTKVSVKKFTNNSSSVGDTWTGASGTLASGAVYVIGHNNALTSASITDVADVLDNIVDFNGNDAVGLYYNDVLVDMIGTANGTDPGTAWDVAGITNATADHTLVRKASVTEGNTDWAASAGTTTENSEWIVYAQDTFDYLGASGEAPLPITLASFTAKTQHGVVELAWETASETNNASFVIYRNDEVLATIEGAGTTSETQNYTYTDATVVPGVAYTYVLADVDYANTETKYEANAVTVTLGNDVVEADFVIGNAYPNPFNPTAIVPLTLSRDAVVNAKVYTLTGREVATLANGTMSAGSHELRITADDMTTGLYLVRIEVENVIDVQKIAFMK